MNPASDLVMQPTVDIDSHAVIYQVSTGVKTQLYRVVLIETSSSSRVDICHVQPFTRRVAVVSCGKTQSWTVLYLDQGVVSMLGVADQTHRAGFSWCEAWGTALHSRTKTMITNVRQLSRSLAGIYH